MRFFSIICLIFFPVLISFSAERPNVVILLADDLGVGDIGCYGGPVKTPHLDQLAAGGIKFTHFYAGAPVCSTARATLLTGRQHVRTGVYTVIQDHLHDMHLRDEEITIAEHLKSNGYATAHIGKWHLGTPFRGRDKPWIDEHGFDYWFATDLNAAPSHRNPKNFWRNRERVGELEGYACHVVVDDAIRWLNEKTRDHEAPFFLNIWFHEPHAPLAAPKEIIAEYGEENDPAALYSATIDNTDRAIGRLFEALKKSGEWDNTIIIYTSDHGSYRGDRNGGLRGGKGSLFEGGIRTPGIFHWPKRISSGAVTTIPVGAVDLLPTICGLAGLDLPSDTKLDGTDLSPLLQSTKTGDFVRKQPLFWSSPTSQPSLAMREGDFVLMGFRAKEFPKNKNRIDELLEAKRKILETKTGRAFGRGELLHEAWNREDKSPEWQKLRSEFVHLNAFQESWIPLIKSGGGGIGKWELYDLKADPKQQHDVADQHPARVKKMKLAAQNLNEEILAEAPDWNASTLERRTIPLVESSCIECHDRDTKTELNFEALGSDLGDPATFRMWEEIFDRVTSGEMPPKKKPRPNRDVAKAALDSIESSLRTISLTQQQLNGRAQSRRLTGIEYEYTLHDLLGIGGDIASKLPPESQTSDFDTVADTQGISPVHIRSYLAAADLALDEVIELGPRPRMEPRQIDYRNHSYQQMWFKRELRQGGNTVLRADDAFVTFDGRPHTTQTDNMGIRFPVAGRYRISADAYAYQAKTPVTFCIYKGNDLAGKVELIGSWQLNPGQPRSVEIEPFFVPGDYFYLAPADLDELPDGKGVFSYGAKDYPGEGLAIRSLTLEGPLEKQWPPERTRQLLGDVGFEMKPDGSYKIVLKKDPLAHVADAVSRFGPEVFRRPLQFDEVKSWVRLAEPALVDGRDFEEALRVVLKAMLSSPEILYHSNNPGKFDDYALATRLSYFLWKSLPDDQLFHLAAEGKMTEPAILASEVDRMLDDEKAQRFISDFLDQWLELEEIDATTPDDRLYPEFDDVLRQAMLEETKLFFTHLIWDDRRVRDLIDTDYAFVNRRLAKHYGIAGVEGLDFQKVTLPENSPRGGILTQASILKVTANGTNTSPVPRGNFVLANLLGTPPNPPPPGIGSIEPDTRGTTTIREELAAHRNVESCASCHQHIDPPGFALESFDPIGGFRSRYRASEGDRPTGKLWGRPIREYRFGPAVDASGTTASGEAFSDIREFKKLLLRKEDQVAQHFIRQLIVYATGVEIQFADREELEKVFAESKANEHRVRGIIHSVVQSQIFRNK